MPSIGLNRIAKDEASVIERCFASARPFIPRWARVDTGATGPTSATGADGATGANGGTATVSSSAPTTPCATGALYAQTVADSDGYSSDFVPNPTLSVALFVCDGAAWKALN